MIDLDAGAPGSLGIAADREHVAAEACPLREIGERKRKRALTFAFAFTFTFTFPLLFELLLLLLYATCFVLLCF